MKTEHAVRREVSEVSRLLWEREWVANHDGNITAKVSPGRIVATPTALSKRVIDADKLIIVDETARVVHGRYRAFSELGLHLRVYAKRGDVGAVVHAHPPFATALAVRGIALPCFLPESVVSLGREIPVVPFAVPGKAAEAALEGFVEDYDVVLLERHGVLAWGVDVEQAYLRLELVEHLAKIGFYAGTVRELPEPVVSDLLAARAKAGLGKRA